MTLLTDIYWDVNGQNLNNWAFNIETLEGRLRGGTMRGSDVVIPYAPGERFTPKVVGSRIITLAMWVRGTTEDGVVPANRQAEFESNWRKLSSLLWNPRQQLTITKRIWVDGSLRTVVAKGQFVGGLEPTMMGRFAGRFTVDIKLHYPWFLDQAYNTVNLVNGHQNVVIPGEVETNQVMVTFNGSRDTPEITNWTTEDSLVYDAQLLSGTRVEIDVMNWQAWYYPTSGSFQDHAAKVVATGAVPMWMALIHGTNDLQLSSITGTGTTQLQYKAAWR